MAKKPSSGLRKEEPKQNIIEYGYLMKHLHPGPRYQHEARAFVLYKPETEPSYLLVIREHGESFPMPDMRDLARQFNMELGSIKGHWVFIADDSEPISKISENESRTE